MSGPPTVEDVVGRRCSVFRCEAKATRALQAEPSGHIKREQVVFGFCDEHVDEYAAGGYKQIGDGGQGRLI